MNFEERMSRGTQRFDDGEPVTYRAWVLREAARVLDEVGDQCRAKMLREIHVPVMDGGAGFVVGRRIGGSDAILIESPRHWQTAPELKEGEVLLVDRP